jgi:hypothetical protein
MDQWEDANLAESFRNATNTDSKLRNRFSPFKLLLLTRQGIAALKGLAVI